MKKFPKKIKFIFKKKKQMKLLNSTFSYEIKVIPLTKICFSFTLGKS